MQVGFVELDDRERPQLMATDGRLRLTGAVGKELGALPGAHVKVWGQVVAAALRVSHYQVLDAGNGFMAYVGFIAVDQRGVRLQEWLNGREWFLLVEDRDAFRALHGAKVWITGLEESPEEIRPLGWGWLDDG